PNGVGYIFENRPVPVTAYPHARVFGDLIYLSSTSARQLDGTYAGAELQKDGSYKLDIEKQSEAALKGIEETLKNLGAKMEHLVDITIYLADIEDLAGFNKVYEEFFPSKEKAPTRGTFAVKNLPSQLALLEIKAIAAVPKTK
ncbi:YjgF-like protein, partial [Rozella allomycis CSF55]